MRHCAYLNVGQGYLLPLKKLPVLKTWELTDRCLYFCNHSDIDLLIGKANDNLLFKSITNMLVLVYNLRLKKKKTFTEQEVANLLHSNSSQLIIDDLLISGTFKKNNDKLVLAE